MLMPDVNVLVYAHRADTREHDEARQWLEALADGEQPFALGANVVAGFVRVVTTKNIFPSRPSNVTDALDFVDELLASPSCRWVEAGAEHWKIFSRLCSAARASGKLVADAQHAAIAIENGCTWVTADGDFARFAAQGLKLRRLTF